MQPNAQAERHNEYIEFSRKHSEEYARVVVTLSDMPPRVHKVYTVGYRSYLYSVLPDKCVAIPAQPVFSVPKAAALHDAIRLSNVVRVQRQAAFKIAKLPEKCRTARRRPI